MLVLILPTSFLSLPIMDVAASSNSKVYRSRAYITLKGHGREEHLPDQLFDDEQFRFIRFSINVAWKAAELCS